MARGTLMQRASSARCPTVPRRSGTRCTTAQSVRLARLPRRPGNARLPARQLRLDAGALCRSRDGDAAWSPRRPAIASAIRTASSCSTMPGRTRMRSTAWTISRSGSAPCPTRPSPDRACWRATMGHAACWWPPSKPSCANPAGPRRTSISIAKQRAPRSTPRGSRGSTCSTTGRTGPAGRTSTPSSPRWTTSTARTSARSAPSWPAMACVSACCTATKRATRTSPRCTASTCKPSTNTATRRR
jgi:hypothetical protein